MTEPWRLITVRPPWSFAIAHLGKRVENRTRSTSYRGPVAIHAGRNFDVLAVDHPALVGAVYDSRLGHGVPPVDVYDGAPHVMHFGHVVALADLIDCHPDDGDCCGPWAERTHTTAGTGITVLHHLVLDDVIPLAEPIPARGQLGLPWRADAALHARLHATPEATSLRQRLVAAEHAEAGDVDDEPRCRDCCCPMGVHDAPEFGGGCEVCGVECDGWR